jgi:hypothetical protein
MISRAQQSLAERDIRDRVVGHACCLGRRRHVDGDGDGDGDINDDVDDGDGDGDGGDDASSSPATQCW